MNSRGQAALEYITTYGWALLVLIILGVVLFTMAAPSGLITKGKTGFSEIDIPRFGLNSTSGDLQVQLHNRLADPVTVTAIYARTADGNLANRTNVSLSVGPGKTTDFINVAVPLALSGGTYAYDVSIEFYYTKISSATLFNSTGTLSGTV
ncbi:MAG: hypothetical protein HYS81_03020 [Candidatus Aenigmatarchaeota archaeon]|nr:MAG: hypothetical protein HYS81_03020 [Candidatus Aenigmarchaeota archaeon]